MTNQTIKQITHLTCLSITNNYTKATLSPAIITLNNQIISPVNYPLSTIFIELQVSPTQLYIFTLLQLPETSKCACMCAFPYGSV